jgi:hypothetical protein
LATRAIERAHQQTDQSLAGRVAGNQRLKRADQCGVFTALQMRVSSYLERSQTQLFQPTNLRLGKVLIGHIRQSWASPPPEGLTQDSHCACRPFRVKRPAPLHDARLEDVGVQLAWFHRQQIAVLDRSQDTLTARPIAIESLAQPRDRHLQRLQRLLGARLVPQRLNQLVIRHRPVGV